jgi:hypothetical protein
LPRRGGVDPAGLAGCPLAGSCWEAPQCTVNRRATVAAVRSPGSADHALRSRLRHTALPAKGLTFPRGSCKT